MVVNNKENSSTITLGEAAPNALAAAIQEAIVPPAAAPGGTGRVVKASLGFMTRDSDAQFIVDTGSIMSGMAKNKAFPTPAPALADLAVARNAYLAAVSAGQDSRLGRSLRQKTRAAFVVLLRQLAHYVEDTSGGDRTILLSSGFKLQRARSPVGLLAPPEEVRLVAGKVSGKATARCRRVAQAKAYQWRLAPAATPTAWSPVVITFAAHADFEGLTPLADYLVQVCVVGTAGASNWSDVATALVM